MSDFPCFLIIFICVFLSGLEKKNLANEQSTINQVLINDTTEYTVKTVMWNEQVSVISQETNTGHAHS